MTVYLKFFANLRTYLPDGEQPYPLQVPPGTTVGEVLERMGVPRDKPAILLLNGRHTEFSRTVEDGDLLAVFPPVAGG